MARTATVQIKQIAERVGLSPSTVSIVLNGRGDEMRISKESQRRVLEAAKENVRIEREKTMKDLQTQIAGLAMASAEKIVGDKEQNIYDQFLGEVGGTDEDTDK